MFKPIKQPLDYNDRLKGRIINSIIVLVFILVIGLLIPDKVTKIIRTYSGSCILEDLSVGDLVSIKGVEMMTVDSSYYDYDTQSDSASLRFEEVDKK